MENGTYDKCLVIDGQQRITTISIMIKAFYDSVQRYNFPKNSFFSLLPYYATGELDDNCEYKYSCRIIPSNSEKIFFEYIMSDQVGII